MGAPLLGAPLWAVDEREIERIRELLGLVGRQLLQSGEFAAEALLGQLQVSSGDQASERPLSVNSCPRDLLV